MLLRGINVGVSTRVNMQVMRKDLEELGFKEVTTYINSGNVFFETDIKLDKIYKVVNKYFSDNYKTNIPFLILNKNKVIEVSKAIPTNWKNDLNEKTDVLYLFDEVNNIEIIKNIPVNLKYINYKYIDGALIINLKRKNYNKSKINNLISSNIYKFVTIRNVNTARKVGDIISSK